MTMTREAEELALEIKHEAVDDAAGIVALAIDAVCEQLVVAKKALNCEGVELRCAYRQLQKEARNYASGVGQIVLEHFADNLPCDIKQIVADADMDDQILDHEPIKEDVRQELRDTLQRIAAGL